MSKLFGKADNSFRAAGGIEGVDKLVADFYSLMDELPEALEIRNMHPENLDQSIDKLARFLCGWLGGPRRYTEKYGSISIPGVHVHLKIGEIEKNAWLNCMKQAIDKQNYSQDFAEYLITQLRVPAERVQQVCIQQQSRPGKSGQMDSG